MKKIFAVVVFLIVAMGLTGVMVSQSNATGGNAPKSGQP